MAGAPEARAERQTHTHSGRMKELPVKGDWDMAGPWEGLWGGGALGRPSPGREVADVTCHRAIRS